MGQESTPALAQDDLLFHTPDIWRQVLVERGKLSKDESLISWFRNHKEFFFPKHMKSSSDVAISSTFSFNRDVQERHFAPRVGQGFVMVRYMEDDEYRSGETQKLRQQLFPLYDGKIDPDGIQVDSTHLIEDEFISP